MLANNIYDFNILQGAKLSKLSIPLITIFLLINNSLSYAIISGGHQYTTLNTFAFGSCFYGRLSTRLDIFKTILLHKPELWVWLGDAAYVDTVAVWDYYKSHLNVDFKKAEEIFSLSKNNEWYSELAKNTPTIGVWDDHDFAINDGNGHFKDKEIAKKLFLDYLDEPKNSERRQEGRGIYTTYSFGDINSHKTARFILLDVRYNKTSLLCDKDADILGEDQWQWLDRVFALANETFIFISSGTQILPFNRIFSEAWYGNSRKRLFNLINKHKKSGVVILSGDVHCAQVLKTFCVLPEIGYDLYEITSSGLSHYIKSRLFMDNVFANDYNFLPTIDTYNFAKIDFNWGQNKHDSQIEVSIIDAENVVRTKLSINYSDLVYRSKPSLDPQCTWKINRRFKSPIEYFSYYSQNKLEILFLVPYIWLFYLIWYLIYFPLWILYKLLKGIYHIVRKITGPRSVLKESKKND